MDEKVIMHMVNVGKDMLKRCEETYENPSQELKEKYFITGYLHDIGKAFQKEYPEKYHGDIGADILENLGFPEDICYAIRHHGKEEHYNDSPLLNALNKADWHIDYGGAEVSIEQRLTGIRKHHTSRGAVWKNARKMSEKLATDERKEELEKYNISYIVNNENSTKTFTNFFDAFDFVCQNEMKFDICKIKLDKNCPDYKITTKIFAAERFPNAKSWKIMSSKPEVNFAEITKVYKGCNRDEIKYYLNGRLYMHEKRPIASKTELEKIIKIYKSLSYIDSSKKQKQK